MTISAETSILPLSKLLQTATADQHERMHRLMEQAQPFADRGRYATFVAAQYLFQQDVAHLAADPALQVWIPDLGLRGRQQAALADLRDLGAEPPEAGTAPVTASLPEAAGWLYVSEGSTLGAAFLFKEVGEKLGLTDSFGARNLAAPAAGRGASWKQFLAALDGRALPEGERRQAVDGANQAYDRFGGLLTKLFGLAGG